MLKIAILGSGYGSNCQAIIDAAESGTLEVDITCVLSDVEDAYILERARNHDIDYYFIDCSPYQTVLKENAEQEVLDILDNHDVQLVILAGFMRIIKSSFLDAYSNKVINIHPSLLPAFPGLNAGKQAFEAGVSETGCTVHFVNEDIDSGEIIQQEMVKVEANDDLDSLMKKIHAAEHVAYPQAIKKIIKEYL